MMEHLIGGGIVAVVALVIGTWAGYQVRGWEEPKPHPLRQYDVMDDEDNSVTMIVADTVEDGYSTFERVLIFRIKGQIVAMIKTPNWHWLDSNPIVNGEVVDDIPPTHIGIVTTQ